MQRHAFKMHLNPGAEAEYKRRHDAIWPELVTLLNSAGIVNYFIHLDRETNVLFGYLERRDGHLMHDLPSQAVMRRWWEAMRDLMRTDETGRPVTADLVEVFHLT